MSEYREAIVLLEPNGQLREIVLKEQVDEVFIDGRRYEATGETNFDRRILAYVEPPNDNG